MGELKNDIQFLPGVGPKRAALIKNELEIHTLEDLLQRVGQGILVTGFNGGNSNPATGNFSYGIEGFYFENGHIVHPVREMLITGNFLGLWGGLLASADDARSCLSKRIPSLAFQNVDVSA